MSQLTTHILDTSTGMPASGINVILYQGHEEKALASGITNEDGRIPALLKTGELLEPGVYRLRFETKAYFDKNRVDTFYPYIEISFQITGSQHYHVPLLLSSFGYSTYRGS